VCGVFALLGRSNVEGGGRRVDFVARRKVRAMRFQTKIGASSGPEGPIKNKETIA
jgi:hypothetical protein